MHGADLYTTADAARDLAFLLRRLHTGKVDYYGDSYATFFGQVFTARFHRMLRSVTLDAAYPVVEANPFYPLALPAAHRGFNRACARSIACRRATRGPSWTRIGAAARYLRKHPVTGRIRDPYGDRTTTHVGIDELIELVNIAGSDSGVYRELDPAIRALLGPGHDTVPLLRLTAQEIFPTEDSGTGQELQRRAPTRRRPAWTTRSRSPIPRRSRSGTPSTGARSAASAARVRPVHGARVGDRA